MIPDLRFLTRDVKESLVRGPDYVYKTVSSFCLGKNNYQEPVLVGFKPLVEIQHILIPLCEVNKEARVIQELGCRLVEDSVFFR